METTNKRQWRCVYCGRYYKPNPRAKAIQKSCNDPRCRTKRKRESRKRWVQANPGCFEGRYAKIKEWRKKNPDYQRLWRKRRREIQDTISLAEPVKTMVLVVPEKLLKSEIQDEIRLVKQCGCGFYVAGGKKGSRDTRFDGSPLPNRSTIDTCDRHGTAP